MDRYLGAVARFVAAVRAVRDTNDEAYLEAQLVEAAFVHPLLVIAGPDADFATSLPVHICVGNSASQLLEIVQGTHVKCQPGTGEAHLDRERLWPHVFASARGGAQDLLWTQRRHWGPTEKLRLFRTPLILDLRPADAIVSAFVPNSSIFVFDESSGSAFLLGCAAALLATRPPLVVATGKLGAVLDPRVGPQIDLVHGIAAKFRYAADSRAFDYFCYPSLDDQPLTSNERAVFNALLRLRDRDHVTLSRTATGADLLDTAFGDQWRRWRKSACHDLFTVSGEAQDLSDDLSTHIYGLAHPAGVFQRISWLCR